MAEIEWNDSYWTKMPKGFIFYPIINWKSMTVLEQGKRWW